MKSVLCVCADAAAAVSSGNVFGWSAIFQFEPACQMSMMNGDLSLAYIDQSLPCIAASNYNNNQQHELSDQQHGYVLPVAGDMMPVQSQSQHIAHNVNASTVQRAARPILGAAANLCLSQANLDKASSANLATDSNDPVSAAASMTVDVITRPPSNSENIANGRHWPPAVDSPNCLRSVTVAPRSSSPVMMHQQLPADTQTANASHQFLVPPYCFISPTAVPSTTAPSGPPVTVSSAVVQPAGSAANLCTAGCCNCGQCQQRNAHPLAPYTYAYPPFMIPGASPFLPGFGYAIPGLAFPPPSLPPVSYNQSTELMYNNQPSGFTLMHQFQRPPPPPPAQAALPSTGRGASPSVCVPFNPMMPPPPSTHVTNPSGRRKNSHCFNCGLVGHQPSVCPEPLMSSSAHTGTSLLVFLSSSIRFCIFCEQTIDYNMTDKFLTLQRRYCYHYCITIAVWLLLWSLASNKLSE